jgi:uncharacterized protein (TIGR02466 family)
MTIQHLFATPLWQGLLDDAALLADLANSVRVLAQDDAAGRRWCRDHRYRGYTSYASLNDLPVRDPAFGALARLLVRQATDFAAAAHLDLAGKRPRLDSLWVNVLKPGGGHSGHIHPHSIISGTLYLEVPDGAGAIRFEDPRLPMLMHAPPRRSDAPREATTFVAVAPVPGMLLLWESWLRHEVLPSVAKADRLSVSFNFS